MFDRGIFDEHPDSKVVFTWAVDGGQLVLAVHRRDNLGPWAGAIYAAKFNRDHSIGLIQQILDALLEGREFRAVSSASDLSEKAGEG